MTFSVDSRNRNARKGLTLVLNSTMSYLNASRSRPGTSISSIQHNVAGVSTSSTGLFRSNSTIIRRIPLWVHTESARTRALGRYAKLQTVKTSESPSFAGEVIDAV
jgi:hypothetical protein